MDEAIPVDLADRNGEKQSRGTLRVIMYSQEERRKRAIKWGVGSLLLAVVSVVLPLAHFFLVPFFLIMTPVVTWYQLRQAGIIISGEARCPVCGADFSFAKRPPILPFDDVCTNCRQAIRVIRAKET